MSASLRRKPGTALITTAAALTLLSSCSAPRVELRDAPDDTLELFDDCTDLETWARESFAPLVTPWGLENVFYFGGGMMVDDAFSAAAGLPNASTEATPRDTSSATNTQEAGVDEGDLVENDGRYVYSAVGGELVSVDTTTGTVVSRYDLPAGEHRLILTARGTTGRMLVATSSWDGSPATTLTRLSVADGVLAPIDVTHLEGSIVATRAADGQAHVIIRHDIALRLRFVSPRDDSDKARDAALTANKAAVAALNAEQLLPRRYLEATDGTIGPLTPALACADTATPSVFSGTGVTYVATADLTGEDLDVRGSGGVVADAQHVYASERGLYLTTPSRDTSDGLVIPQTPAPAATVIHAFTLGSGGARYQASGTVAGQVLSPYSLSEHQGVLRVATTTDGAGFGRDRMSGIRVLRADGDRLTQIGEIDGLGRGETIQGVRFAGDLAFVVTFEQIDPLYVVDLADPANPELRGELKIPGFSTWLLPTGDGRLLAFGRSGDDTGNLDGVQWSLFDIRDLDNPTLLATAEAGSWSEALNDPLAILVHLASGLVAAPTDTQMADGGRWPVSDDQSFWNGSRRAAPTWSISLGKITGGGPGLEATTATTPFPVRRLLLVDGRLVAVGSEGSMLIYADADAARAGAAPVIVEV